MRMGRGYTSAATILWFDSIVQASGSRGAPVASLEHLVLIYLYSRQPRHLGDLARIVVETRVDLALVERYLAETHPEMLSVFGRSR
jgi:hypothetical protein